jgi:hypothetical protein
MLQQSPSHSRFGRRRGGGGEAEALVVEGLREQVALEEDLHVEDGVGGRHGRRLHPTQEVKRLRSCPEVIEQPQHATLFVL